MRPLTPIEARVLGTLMEKARTVPDSYPLTLNALVSGCNQRSSREPPMQLEDSQAQQALDSLKLLSLVLETSGGRTARWQHNFERAVSVPAQSAALLGLLMLRGPQTAGELRLNAERWHRFADISSVEAFLDELQQRPDDKGGPLVLLLPRKSGLREQRWVHLLCGPVASDDGAEPDASDQRAAGANDTAMEARIAALEAELASLRAALDMVCAELGLSPPRQNQDSARATTAP